MDDDETSEFSGILGKLGQQPGGLLAGLFPPQPSYDPRQPGGLPPGADPAALSLAAAASAADLARTLQRIDHQAAIMTAFGKAVGAPGTAGPSSQGADTGSSDPGEAPDASSSGPVLAQHAPAQAAPAAPINANTVFQPSPVPLPPPRPKVPQWPTPWTAEQRWPGPENPDTSTLLQRVAAIPAAANLPKSGETLDWSTLPRSTKSLPLPSLSEPSLDNPDTTRLLKSMVDAPSPNWSKAYFPTLYQFGIDPDDLVRRIVRAESAGNPNATTDSSSATGLGQFTKRTWREVFKHARPDLDDFWTTDPKKEIDPEKDKKILPLRTDPALSRQMVAAYADQNVKALEHASLPVTYRNIYLAHFLGPNDAPKVLRADPNALAVSVVSPASVSSNRRVITPTTTVRDLIQWAEDKMEHGAAWQRRSR